MPTRSTTEFPAVFAKLRTIMRKHERGAFKAMPDKPGNYCLIGPPSEFTRGRDLWFGAVQIKKNYVSYHLIAVYAFPELQRALSPALKKRMQGKSCFNFTEVDDALFKEIAQLTANGYRTFKRKGIIP